MEFIVIWLLLAIGVGALASSRGRSFLGYFLLSIVLSPLIGLIVVLVVRDLAAEAQREDLRRRDEETRERERNRDHQKQLEEIRVLSQAKPPAEAPVRSIADEIEKLGTLKERGLLTEEEFQAQKTALLKR